MYIYMYIYVYIYVYIYILEESTHGPCAHLHDFGLSSLSHVGAPPPTALGASSSTPPPSRINPRVLFSLSMCV